MRWALRCRLQDGLMGDVGGCEEKLAQLRAACAHVCGHVFARRYPAHSVSLPARGLSGHRAPCTAGSLVHARIDPSLQI